MSDEPVILQIGSERHAGWQEVRIRLSLEQIADEYALTLSERWSEPQGKRPLSPDVPCTLSVGGELLLTGHLEDVRLGYSAYQHTVVASGRSKAGDLIDCSGRERRLDGLTLAQIAQTLAQPYGIEVLDTLGAARPFRSFVLEDGQPIAEAIERAAQLRGARVVSDAQGRLLIVHAVLREVRTPLILGKNIRQAAGTFSNRDRFNHYLVEGQTPGDNQWNGLDASGPTGSALDPRVRRPRSTLLLCDIPADSRDCTARAELEARMRWAKGRTVSYSLSGWMHEQGIWRPGDLVQVQDGYLGLNERLLVSEVQLLDGPQGRHAELRVAPVAAFEPVPIAPLATAGTNNEARSWGW